MALGFIVISLGVLYLLHVLCPGFNIDYSIIWPCAIILVGISTMIQDKKVSLWNVIITFVGIWFLLINLNVITGTYKDIFFPVIIILIGVSMLISSLNFKKNCPSNVVTNENSVNYSAVFSGVKEKVSSKNFKGTNVLAIFGGADLDLRDIEIKDDVVINVTSIFGGTSLILPEDKYNIKINRLSIFGGVDNKNMTKEKDSRKTIYINATSVFGGLNIK